MHVGFWSSLQGHSPCCCHIHCPSTVLPKEVGYFFNRKEVKTHGDRGILVGAYPSAKDKIVMVDDVVTDGLTKKEAIRMVQSVSDASISAILIAVDRMESNTDGKANILELECDSGVPIYSIVTIDHICEYLLNRNLDGTIYLNQETYQRIKVYRQQFQIRKPQTEDNRC